jgi:hypothetical protein
MLETNIYNIDRDFDYLSIKAFVVKSLEKIVKEQTLRKRTNVTNNAVNDCGSNNDTNNVKLSIPATPSLKLKIRNTTKYLNWRLSILKRDNFTCKICHTSMKDDKSLRVEVHHAKTFNDICNENNVTTLEQALECKELWNLNNGISTCYKCHKDIETVRTKLRNMFWLEDAYT